MKILTGGTVKAVCSSLAHFSHRIISGDNRNNLCIFRKTPLHEKSGKRVFTECLSGKTERFQNTRSIFGTVRKIRCYRGPRRESE